MKEISFDEVRNTVIQLFSRQVIIPIVGSGISCGSPARKGFVPSGAQMKEHILKALLAHPGFAPEEQESFPAQKLQELCGLYFDEEIIASDKAYRYLEDNFSDARIDDARKKFFDINWPYIYSLNIDDSIESSTAYKQVILPGRPLKDSIFSTHKCVIKLHGDIKEILAYEDARKVFVIKEYAVSIQENASLLSKLRNDYRNLNIIYVGCSLDDEFDLSTLDSYKTSIVPQQIANRIFFCTTADVPLSKKSALKSYGITDIVKFSDYDDIYNQLYAAWEEAQKLPRGSLDEYANLHVSQIRDNYTRDMEYLLYGKNPIRDRNIELPSFYIKRSLAAHGLDQNKTPGKRLHFIKGRRISGKTYFLINLYNLFPSYKKFFFSNEVLLNNEAFKTILDYQGSIIFFDSGSISPDQFRLLLSRLRNTGSYFFVVSGKGAASLDSALIKCIQDNVLNRDDFKLYELDSSLDEEELEAINARLPFAYLPPFNEMSIIDNIISIAYELDRKTKFSERRAKIDTVKDIAYLILLATWKSASTLALVAFDLDDVHYMRRNYYAPLIEEIEVSSFEKCGADMSARRVILNAPVWLYRSLGYCSISDANIEKIAQAYEFLIKRIITVSRGDKRKRRLLMRKLIFFETINSIFAKWKHGQKRLIHAIYEKLRPILANDYDFLHQSVKCDLWEKAGDNRQMILEEALTKLVIAIRLAEVSFEQTGSPAVAISIDHMEFTRATLLSEIVMLKGFSSIEDVCRALDSIAAALYSPYNYDDAISLIKGQRPGRIISMLDVLAADKTALSALPADSRALFNRIWNQVREMRAPAKLGRG